MMLYAAVSIFRTNLCLTPEQLQLCNIKILKIFSVNLCNKARVFCLTQQTHVKVVSPKTKTKPFIILAVLRRSV